jgi:hypothetical protein
LEARELLLHLLFTPALLLPLVAGGWVLLAWALRWRSPAVLALALLPPLAVSTIYSPIATALLTAWLQGPLPASAAPASTTPVVVLVGRGPDVAAATTAAAAHHLSRQPESVVYVSGDQRSTAERLLTLGVPPARIAGDSCARTTWENATRTAPWLRQHHPGAPVLHHRPLATGPRHGSLPPAEPAGDPPCRYPSPDPGPEQPPRPPGNRRHPPLSPAGALLKRHVSVAARHGLS